MKFGKFDTALWFDKLFKHTSLMRFGILESCLKLLGWIAAVPHLGVLQDGLSVLAYRGSPPLLLVGLDPADVLTPPEAPLLQAVAPGIQALGAATPAHYEFPRVSWKPPLHHGVYRVSWRPNLHIIGFLGFHENHACASCLGFYGKCDMPAAIQAVGQAFQPDPFACSKPAESDHTHMLEVYSNQRSPRRCCRPHILYCSCIIFRLVVLVLTFTVNQQTGHAVFMQNLP